MVAAFVAPPGSAGILPADVTAVLGPASHSIGPRTLVPVRKDSAATSCTPLGSETADVRHSVDVFPVGLGAGSRPAP
jgi:hypothetical protein